MRKIAARYDHILVKRRLGYLLQLAPELWQRGHLVEILRERIAGMCSRCRGHELVNKNIGIETEIGFRFEKKTYEAESWPPPSRSSTSRCVDVVADEETDVAVVAGKGASNTNLPNGNKRVAISAFPEVLLTRCLACTGFGWRARTRSQTSPKCNLALKNHSQV